MSLCTNMPQKQFPFDKKKKESIRNTKLLYYKDRNFLRKRDRVKPDVPNISDRTVWGVMNKHEY